ncbi:hypothetical protein AVEN_226077-1 [Araneus ventricosus]|uniref:Uncharacterized protein n=1 Tax=Araneus ventricosus TaxID=182803 RepID=A0A4Y2GVQ5_ARAVE|nr:hypothetical protein AVEN_226077-1 [Araneus ventricosus]
MTFRYVIKGRLPHHHPQFLSEIEENTSPLHISPWGKNLHRVAQPQPLDRFQQCLFYMKAYDLKICYQLSPAIHRPPFLREIEKTRFHCTFSAGKTHEIVPQPQPLERLQHFLFHMEAYDSIYVVSGRLQLSQPQPSTFERNRENTTSVYILYGEKS